uniref:Uncharacterized protein n=1 Tax=Arundo donax TaxID=35708 RepID=A0A0A9DQI4_ARUDO
MTKLCLKIIHGLNCQPPGPFLQTETGDIKKPIFTAMHCGLRYH